MKPTSTSGDELLAALRNASEPQLDASGGQPLNLRMRALFDTAKRHRAIPLTDIETLLDHLDYQARLAAVCVLDFKARAAKTQDEHRPLCELYLRCHDRINTWDMVDRAAPWVVGAYLTGRDLTPLHTLATSTVPIERRTAITAPLYFVKGGTDDDINGAFEIAALLATDQEPVVYNAVGIFIKHAGRRDPHQQRAFLDTHAPTMARPGLRLAIIKLEPADRHRYLNAR